MSPALVAPGILRRIPRDFPVRPLRRSTRRDGKTTCGTCGLSWDDDKVTSMTPTPSARCPFEAFHEPEREPAHAKRLVVARDAREASYTVQAGVPTLYTRPLGVETTEGYRGIVNCLLCGAAVLLMDADSATRHNAWHARPGVPMSGRETGRRETFTTFSGDIYMRCECGSADARWRSAPHAPQDEPALRVWCCPACFKEDCKARQRKP